MVEQRKKKASSPYGRLVWKNSKTGEEKEIRTGPWALLNSIKSKLCQDPCYAHGKFRLSHLTH